MSTDDQEPTREEAKLWRPRWPCRWLGIHDFTVWKQAAPNVNWRFCMGCGLKQTKVASVDYPYDR